MQISWFGAACFKIVSNDCAFFVDPYLSRPENAQPHLQVDLEDISRGVSRIFITHGHYDHILDVPRMAELSGAMIYCSEKVAQALAKLGVDKSLLHISRHGDLFDFGNYSAGCFHSRHIIFDLPIILRGLLSAFKAQTSMRMLLDYPMGQVLSWRFTLDGEGNRTIHHFGSAGCTKNELCELTRLPSPDILLFPLAGHTDICQIATEVVKKLSPRIVIPMHHDDFLPPISTHAIMDISPFFENMKALKPAIKVLELPFGETIVI
ncbi:MAG: MBL fold metallo-hydrolase [Anaerolineaceae bacterium]|nr:MBL fold metallo-hydrolase [Anaerolineaceae bacterium]